MIWQPSPGGIKGPPRFKIPIPPSNPQILNTYKETWDQNEIMLILDVWWFDNPAPVELKGLPTSKPKFRLETCKILNTHKEILVQNEIMLILDIWWFDNPAPGGIKRSPPLQNPNSTFKPSNFKHLQRNLGPKWNYANFRCMVIWQPSPGGIMGAPCFKIPIPPSNPQI